jgi:glycosyltransferase involved in cell wall biosynthesis
MNFSVIIPLFNKALHIERAIKSIFEQTCQDFEIIVVNDGSTDNGREIVERINDPRLRLINQHNQGVSVARNRGTYAASNKFIAFLDADDEWLPDFLRNIQILINNFPDCGAYATAIKTVRPQGYMYYPSVKKLHSEPWIGILPNFFELIQEGLAIHASSTVFPKQVLLDVGGYPAGVKVSEDVFCWINVAMRYPIAYSPKRLVIYHQEATNRHEPNNKEEPYLKIIQEGMENGLISGELKIEALELMAQRQIFIATANIMAGNPGYALQLLSTCAKTRKYKKRWLWWRFWASFPSGWPSKFLIMKQKILGANS